MLFAFYFDRFDVSNGKNQKAQVELIKCGSGRKEVESSNRF